MSLPESAARAARTAACGVALSCALSCAVSAGPGAPPPFGDVFWSHWGDGRAEVSGYELTYSRYGEERTGTAVAIFVTEPFSEARRVKSDRADDGDAFQVLKLNLAQDFPTGVYDYNMMTSAFLALEPRGEREAGRLAKIAFSSQEWCGQVFAQLWLDGGAGELESHSYFDGEGDDSRRLELTPETLAEESLFFWARGLASPVLSPGGRRRVQLLRSLEQVRLRHLPLQTRSVELRRGETVETLEVPAGRFEVTRNEVLESAGAPLWTFWVERAAPHRLIRWQRADGTRAELLGSERMDYWAMSSGPAGRGLKSLGLEPRPRRTP